MEIYFLKAVACLSILLLFYKLLLEKENMHNFKRFFLLMVPVISFGIPAISFPEYVIISSRGTASLSEVSISTAAANFPLFEILLSSFYIMGLIFFGSRFLINLNSLLKRARNNPKVETLEATHVLLKDDISPHTFWSYIYLNRNKFENDQIPQEVMDHELAHVRQKHTADILFMELLQVLLWFLPLVYLLKKAVRLNHEFLADSAALQKAENIGLYQEILLSFSSGEQNNLVNSINYQSIKKRFTVMKKQPSQKAILVRTIIFLPLLAILLYSFSSRETIMLEEYKPNDELFQEKATPEMVTDYNKWAKHNNENKNAFVKVEVWKRMKYIYSIMTPAQKKEAEEFPDLNPNYIITIEEVENHSKNKTSRERNGEVPSPPPPPPAPPVSEDGQIPPPPPPPAQEIKDLPVPHPPPPSPEEAIKKWMNEDAEFFYNGKKVSGKEALKVVQENDGRNLKVNVKDDGSKKTVRISDNKK
ncbi:M56 family metallopeptidase [Salinimicrobium sp. TH3]|uniref:M56 family metallopeptidase n=1 Tax=Salinimicrobium sp. TH3 TaxID=2997342 RepID=UPI002275F568|nr:M56 family metallopeptidase [Salinimicrobium sp. TH3]MCY2686129.1 M56 family metallopeptidase [Salinimicrobium sp. TH3]